MQLLDLNDDCLRLILFHLDARSLCRFSQVSRISKEFCDRNKNAKWFSRANFDVVVAADLELSKFQYVAQNDATDVILEDTSNSLQSFSLKSLLCRTSYGHYNLAVVTLVARFFDLNTAIKCLDEAQIVNANQYSFSWEDIANGAEAKENTSMTRETVVQIVGFDRDLCKALLKIYADVIGPFDEQVDLEKRTKMQYELLLNTLSDENKSLEFVDLWNTDENLLLITQWFCKDSGQHEGTLADFRFSFIAVNANRLKHSLDALLRKLQNEEILHHYAQYGNTFLLIPKNRIRLNICLEEVSPGHLSVCIQNARGLYVDHIRRLQLPEADEHIFGF